MLYTEQDVFDYIEQEDVKFIRLTFCETAKEYFHHAP